MRSAAMEIVLLRVNKNFTKELYPTQNILLGSKKYCQGRLTESLH